MAQTRDGRAQEAATERGVCSVLKALRDDARGTTAIEYGMIAFLVFAVAAGGIRLYGSKLNTVYANIGTTISQAQ